MDKTVQVPSVLLLQWEREALEEKVSLHGLKEYVRMKEKIWRESLAAEEVRPQIFANAARNKLTAYGNKVALDHFLKIPVVERTCRIARIDMETLQRKLSGGFVSDEQKRNFLSEREQWFAHLKERMKDLRISKETLETFGMSWKAAKSFAYQTV